MERHRPADTVATGTYVGTSYLGSAEVALAGSYCSPHLCILTPLGSISISSVVCVFSCAYIPRAFACTCMCAHVSTHTHVHAYTLCVHACVLVCTCECARVCACARSQFSKLYNYPTLPGLGPASQETYLSPQLTQMCQGSHPFSPLPTKPFETTPLHTPH